ncbi:unnamed protein product [Meloidogyne enterolobii]|uniref:Uncharacterized protein n=1 Tax=Meloidogyne enterolobii TaxID=390850 RepID=A0ACB1AJ47_MELEN
MCSINDHHNSFKRCPYVPKFYCFFEASLKKKIFLLNRSNFSHPVCFSPLLLPVELLPLNK